MLLKCWFLRTDISRYVFLRYSFKLSHTGRSGCYTMYILKSRNRSVGTSCIQFESFPWLSLATQLRGIKNNICCLSTETKKRLATQILDTYHLSMSDETSTYATCQFNQEERIDQLISCTGEKQYVLSFSKKCITSLRRIWAYHVIYLFASFLLTFLLFPAR